VPTTITSYPTPFARIRALPVELFDLADLLVTRLVLRELERLLASQREHAEHHERIIKQPMYPVLQRLPNVDDLRSTDAAEPGTSAVL